MTTTTAVICCYTEDRWDRIVSGIASLTCQPELTGGVCLVVDHNPELARRARHELSGSTVRVLENRQAKGLSGARNTGVAATDAEIVLFLDDDARATGSWVRKLVDAFEDPSVMAAGSRVLPDWEGGVRPSWLPPEFDWVMGCSYNGLPTTEAPIRNPIGAGMAVRRSAFELVGGFSSEVGRIGALPIGCEETEFSIRITKADPGAKILHLPDAEVHHWVPSERQRRSYFLSRCYHEGISKAVLSTLEGARAGLSSERAYVLGVIPERLKISILQGLRQRSLVALAPAIMTLAGLTAACLGYLRSKLSLRAGRG
jgi:GT2 family glycosyltransferase